MATKGKQVDMGGLTIVCDRIVTGISRPKAGFTVPDTMVSGGVSDKAFFELYTTGATRTILSSESGKKFYVRKADGVVFTLPVIGAANVGMYFDFVVNTTITSNAFKLSTGTQGTEFINGTLVVQDSDGTVTSGAIFTGDGSTHDNISMNGTTTGGVAGTSIRITATTSTLWTVEGYYVGSGAVASPFSTT